MGQVRSDALRSEVEKYGLAEVFGQRWRVVVSIYMSPP